MNIRKHVDLTTLDNIITAIPSNIFYKNEELKYVFSSHIWEQVDNGGDEDFDIYGKTDRDIRKDAVNVEKLEELDRKILETGVGTRYTIKSEVDGHIQYLELVKEPVKDDEGNITGIVGLINDVTAVTQEMSDMLENEKEYRSAMKIGAQLAYEANLTKDIIEDELIKKTKDGENDLLDLIGMKSPCSYSEMVDRYAEKVLIGESQNLFKETHNAKKLIDLFNQGEREVTNELKFESNNFKGGSDEVWYFETILLMHNTKGEIIAFFAVNDVTEQRRKEEEIRHQLEENVKEAERVANMKSDFLANMSHEIRTPMNAVIGMSELALREDLPEAARDYINQIKTSGNALLSIINDILDFSKIESGKLDIIPDKYNVASEIHDVSSLLMSRIGEKNIEFIAQINPNLPSEMVGDSSRIRQVLINLANNAIKFTEKGYVRTDIDFEKKSEDEILLKISVKDTGIGIKEEDFDKLFVSFQQVDSKRNRNIEGTGLGLAICSRLVSLMGGTISVSSEYGKGSVFSFTVPQKVNDWTPIINVKEKDKKMVIVNWPDEEIRNTNYAILNELEVEYHEYEDIEILKEKHKDSFENKQVYILTDYKSYNDELSKYIDLYSEIQFVVICDWSASVDDSGSNAFLIKKPLSTISIGMALNNESFHSMENDDFEFSFTAPDAKVLIVDDNDVNLSVAEGILDPLKMQITTANSGKKALECIENEQFDLVFMDHMMPDLDGVETTRIIRRLYPQLDNMPIIALSANALSDAREMFLKEGMNDFVAKPIEMKIITSKIAQWLPPEKILKMTGPSDEVTDDTSEMEKLSIVNWDTDYALSMIGSQKLYFTILEKFVKNINTKAALIKSAETSEDIKSYTIEVHALKSSSKQLGAMELSAMAAELEACGNAEDIITIHEKTDALIEKYIGYYDILSSLFDDEETEEKAEISRDSLLAYFDKMLDAADELNLMELEELSCEMDHYSYAGEAKELFIRLKEAASNIDPDSIIEIINEWKNILRIEK